MNQRRDHYTDGDVAFYLQLWRDYGMARVAMRFIRKRFPTSRIILISDGDPDPKYPGLAREFGAHYTLRQRLYPVNNGGKMIQRMLDEYLAGPEAYLIKVDTDTRIHRRFRYLPTGLKLFGTLEPVLSPSGQPLPPNVQGGCVGFTREAASVLARSGLLLSDRLLDYRNTYAVSKGILWRCESGLMSFDFVIRYACYELGVALEQFDEVNSVWRGRHLSLPRRFAVTHPHKSDWANYGGRVYLTRILPRKLLGLFKLPRAATAGGKEAASA